MVIDISFLTTCCHGVARGNYVQRDYGHYFDAALDYNSCCFIAYCCRGYLFSDRFLFRQKVKVLKDGQLEVAPRMKNHSEAFLL